MMNNVDALNIPEQVKSIVKDFIAYVSNFDFVQNVSDGERYGCIYYEWRIEHWITSDKFRFIVSLSDSFFSCNNDPLVRMTALDSFEEIKHSLGFQIMNVQNIKSTR
jgi:hypothetical protein